MTALILAAFVAAAVPAVAAAPDEATAQQIVDYALRTPTSDMDPKLANAFLDIDVARLPKKKQEKARAKQLELQILLKISKDKKKGGIRWPAPEGCESKVYGPGDVGALQMAGFAEILDDEESFLEEKTKCTEKDLRCEFSLTIVLIPHKKGPATKRFFLHGNDPINALLGEYRNKNVGGQTKFFGGGVFTCNH